jgi:hypothetical protein
MSLTEHEQYDLAFDLGTRILRVQCKWARRDGGVVLVKVARSRTSRRGYIRTTYREDEVDALAAYCQELDRCYLLPVSIIAGKHSVYLRTSAARNNQRAAIHFAADYELGAVAQLEERSDGIRKVEGSSPSSSIPTPRATTALNFPPQDDLAELKHTVGMDEFYAKLAQIRPFFGVARRS